MKKIILIITLLCIIFLLRAKRNNLKPVENFQLNRYLGKWYEIARFPHFFEKDLDRVTAEYKLLDNGKIEVINRGFNKEKSKWKDAKGKAWIAAREDVGHLKVSFFWPFSSDYKIVWLENDYSTAVVVGNNFKYFWILSRNPNMNEIKYDMLIDKAADWGFDKTKIIRVNH